MKGQKQKNEKVNGNDTMGASEKQRSRQKCEEGIKAIEWRKKKESEGVSRGKEVRKRKMDGKRKRKERKKVFPSVFSAKY